MLDDGRVVSASKDRTLRVWDPDSGETVKTLEGHSDAVSSVAALGAGRVVSASNDFTLRVWDADSGEVVASFHADAALVCVAACGEDVLVAGDKDGKMHFLRLVESASR